MNKAFSMLGLASKAGKIVTGEDTIRNAIRKGKVKLLIISEDASQNTQKRFLNAAAHYSIEYVVWGHMDDLGKYIGKNARSVVAIVDDNFGRIIKDLLSNTAKEKENPGGELFE